jgi:hypothetical protein
LTAAYSLQKYETGKVRDDFRTLPDASIEFAGITRATPTFGI